MRNTPGRRLACLLVLFPSLVGLGCHPSALPPKAGLTGAHCSGAVECAGNVCLPYEQGHCTSDCTHDACPAGTVCRARDGGNFCFVGCDDAAGCRAGYQCLEGACVPACTADGSCPGGLKCVGGACTRMPGKPQGEACGADEECSSAYCEPVSAACQVRCAREDDCSSGQTCFYNPVDTDGNGDTDAIHPICILARAGQALGAACGIDGDCARGQCQYGICSVLCQPGGASGGCAAPFVCKSAFAMVTEDVPPLQECLPARGTLELPMDSDAFALGVPEHAVSLGLWARNEDDDFSYYTGISQLSDAGGEDLYSSQVDLYQNTLRYQAAPAASMMVISNSPLVPFRPGSVYSFSAFSANRSSYGRFHLRARVRVSDRPKIDSGHMPVHVFVTNLAGGCYRGTLNAANAHQVLSGFETKMRSIFAQAQITIDEFRYEDSRAASQITLMNYDSPELDDLLRTATTGDTPDAAEIVLIRHIDDPTVMPGYEILGVAGGIPGSSGIPGTVRSGAAVSLSSLCFSGQQQLAITAAHELGHTLGLYHTIESDRVHMDQMDDDDGEGTANLMYWAEGSAIGHLSPQQVAAIITNPMLHD